MRFTVWCVSPFGAFHLLVRFNIWCVSPSGAFHHFVHSRIYVCRPKIWQPIHNLWFMHVNWKTIPSEIRSLVICLGNDQFSRLPHSCVVRKCSHCPLIILDVVLQRKVYGNLSVKSCFLVVQLKFLSITKSAHYRTYFVLQNGGRMVWVILFFHVFRHLFS